MWYFIVDLLSCSVSSRFLFFICWIELQFVMSLEEINDALNKNNFGYYCTNEQWSLDLSSDAGEKRSLFSVILNESKWFSVVCDPSSERRSRIVIGKLMRFLHEKMERISSAPKQHNITIVRYLQWLCYNAAMVSTCFWSSRSFGSFCIETASLRLLKQYHQIVLEGSHWNEYRLSH